MVLADIARMYLMVTWPNAEAARRGEAVGRRHHGGAGQAGGVCPVPGR